MLSKKAKEQLVRLADDLDQKGFGEEADMIDGIVNAPNDNSAGREKFKEAYVGELEDLVNLSKVADYLVENYGDNDDLINNVFNPLRGYLHERQSPDSLPDKKV